jgi:hypothetical protein
MSVDDFIIALDHIHELPYIEQRRDNLLREVETLTRQTSVLSNNLEYLKNQATAIAKTNTTRHTAYYQTVTN